MDAEGAVPSVLRGEPHPKYLACGHICRISTVLVNVLLLTEVKKSHICRQIWLKRSPFVGKLVLYTPTKIFLSVTPRVY